MGISNVAMSAIKAGVKTGVKAGVKIGKELGGDAATESAMNKAMGGEGKIGLQTAIESGSSRKIAKESISMAANLGVALITGPAAIVLMIAAALGMLLDAMWNPYQAYFNDDLSDFKKAYDQSVTSMFISAGYNWPLEVKPTVLPLTDEEYNTFQKYREEYFTRNNLVSAEEAYEAKTYFDELRTMRRMNSIMIMRPNQTDIDVFYRPINYVSSGETPEERLLLIEFARKLGKKKAQSRINKIQSSLPNRIIQFSKKNWQLYIIILICLSIIIFSCIILIKLI